MSDHDKHESLYCDLEKERAKYEELLSYIHCTEKLTGLIYEASDEAELYSLIIGKSHEARHYTSMVFLLNEDKTRLGHVDLGKIEEQYEKFESFSSVKRFLRKHNIDLRNAPLYRKVVAGETIYCDRVLDLMIQEMPELMAKSILKIEDVDPECGCIVTPLKRYDEVIGVLAVSSPLSRKAFMPTVKNLGNNISRVLEKIYEEKKQKKLSSELQKSERKYRSILNNIEDIVYSLDAAGVVTYISPQVKLYGYRPEEVIGKKFTEFLCPEDVRLIMECFNQSMVSGISEPVEFRLMKKDGTLFYVEERGEVVFRNGKPHSMSGIIRDISERKEAEKNLHEQNQFLNTVLESLTHPFYVLDAKDYTIIMANNAARAIGLECGTKCHKAFFDKNEPCGGEDYTCLLEEVKKSKSPLNIEQKHCKENGNTSIYSVYGYPILDENGEVVQMIEYVIDVTEKRRAEEELKRSEAKFRVMYESAPVGIGFVKDRIITNANDQLVNIIGYDADEISNKSSRKLYESDEEFERVGRKYQELIETGISTFETRWIHKDGRELDILLSSGILNKGDLSEGIIITVLDITELKQLDKRLQFTQSVVDHHNDTALWLDITGRLFYVNDAAATMLGYSREELLQMYVWEFDQVYIREFWQDYWTRMHPKIGSIFKSRFRTRDGKSIPVEISAKYIEYEGESNLIAFVRDISQREQTETLIKAEKELGLSLSAAKGLKDALRMCVDTALEVTGMNYGAIYIVDEETGVLNMEYYTENLPADFVDVVLRYEPDTPNAKIVMAGKPVYSTYADIAPPEMPDAEFRGLAVIPIKHDGKVIACMNLTSDELYEIPDMLKHHLESVGSRIGSAIAKIRAEEAKKESEKKYRDLIENIDEVIFRINADEIVDYISPACFTVMGRQPEEIIGESYKQVLIPGERDSLDEFFRRAINGESMTYEHRIAHKSGKLHWVQSSIRPVYADDAVVGIQGVLRDITGRKNAEQERDRMFNYSQDMLCIVGYDGYFKDVNPAVTKTLGWTREELTSNPLHPEELQSTLEAVEGLYTGKELSGFENRYRCKDGTYRWISWNSIPMFREKLIYAVARDVTERIEAEEKRRELEKQLFHAQKMESIGRLAGGIAHNFNNILTGIMGCAELLKMKFADSGSSESQAAGVILDGAERASNLTKQLLGFARGGKYNPVPLKINSTIKNVLRVSEKIFEKNIKVAINFGNIPNVVADGNQIDQVLTNLIINAKDAMPGGGVLSIITSKTALTNEQVANMLGAVPGDYVEVSVSDTGIGMTKEVRERIFEPFFSTKGESKGTGLGLAAVYGIIKNHGGHITVDSEQGRGSTFSIFLPATEKATRGKMQEGRIYTGKGKILVIDDEENVRNVAKVQLESLGYSVLLAKDGRHGLYVYRNNKNTVDLILLDMVMPNMSGGKAFSKLKEVDPDVKIVFMSGFSRDEKATELMNVAANGFIQKPFRINELSEVIADNLGT